MRLYIAQPTGAFHDCHQRGTTMICNKQVSLDDSTPSEPVPRVMFAQCHMHATPTHSGAPLLLVCLAAPRDLGLLIISINASAWQAFTC
jgi:hypothetical protein